MNEERNLICSAVGKLVSTGYHITWLHDRIEYYEHEVSYKDVSNAYLSLHLTYKSQSGNLMLNRIMLWPDRIETKEREREECIAA